MASSSRLELAFGGRQGAGILLAGLLLAAPAAGQSVVRSVVSSSSTPTPNQPVAAPTNVTGTPAHLSIVDGPATLARDGHVEAAIENMPLLSGDRIRTDIGRVEVLFADGSAIDLDTNTDVDLLSDSLLRLRTGRLRLTIAHAGDLAYRIDAAGTTTWIRASGQYAIQAGDPRAIDQDVRVDVIQGLAELVSGSNRTSVGPGAEAVMTARDAPLLAYATTAPVDAFDQWSDETTGARTGTDMASDSSAQYLPDDLRDYDGALDSAGDWQYADGYGYVWYPRVAATWRPYSSGQWRFVPGAGWCWVGTERWSWPTHHYGRWGLQADRWFWIPGRQWAAAWVSWAGAPGAVAWCPLDIHNKAVFPVTTIASGRGLSRGWTVGAARLFATSHTADTNATEKHIDAERRWTVRSAAPAHPVGSVTGARALTSPTTARLAISVAPRTDAFASAHPRSSTSSPRDTRPNAAGARMDPAAALRTTGGRQSGRERTGKRHTSTIAGAASPTAHPFVAPIDLSRRELPPANAEPPQASTPPNAGSTKDGAADSPAHVIHTPALPGRGPASRGARGSAERSGGRSSEPGPARSHGGVIQPGPANGQNQK